MPASRIIIVGGGFAAVKCAKKLRARLPRDQWEVVVFNKENHMVFHPMLAEVAGASLNPDSVAAPLRQTLKGVVCRTEEITNVDVETKEVEYESHDGQTRRMKFDQCVVACGSIVNLGMVPGMSDHAFAMKTVGDAVNLKAHVMQQLEKAEVCDDLEKKRWYLSFVVVGGGYSGVETAGEINDLARGSVRFFSNIKKEDITVTVIHSRDQLLPEIGEKLRLFAMEKMRQAGIKLVLNARVQLATPEGVGIKDGGLIRGATIVCTIGNSASPIVERMKAPKEKGRLKTDPDMRLTGQSNMWAIGDCAENINSLDNKPSPPTAQFAERQGTQCAENIVRVIRKETTKPFIFKQLGQLCCIGGHSAVAEMFGFRISGFIAWFMWRGIYLMKMPSWSRRFKAAFDWSWQLLFSRDLSHLRTDPTERVSNAYYQPGDYIFREGDPATNFYVINTGEVEIVRKNGEKDDILAVLGPGDFFGEMALVNNKPRSASVRARTTLEIVVMGRNVFSQVSQALTPLRRLIAVTVSRRTRDIWARLPIAKEILERSTFADFIEHLPTEPIPASTTFEKTLALFGDKRVDFCCVVDDKNKLIGLVTRTDLFRALESGASRETRVSDFMLSDPVTVAADDSTIVAASTMREHSLKWLPVVDNRTNRHVKGFVSSHAIVSRIVGNMPTGAAMA